MASLLSPRRTGSPLSLRATETREETGSAPPEDAPPAPFSWPLVAVAGGVATAVVGWIVCAGLTALGWLAADSGTLADALRVGTRIWLLGNGVSVEFGNVPVTLVPWGVTALFGFVLSRSAGLAARQVGAEQRVGPGPIAVVTTAAYVLPVLAAAVLFGEPWLAPGHWAVVIAVLATAAAWGASRTLRIGLTRRWPAWTRPLPRAVVAAQLALLVAGAAVLVTGLLVHLDRVTALSQALDTGVAGGIALLLLQLAFAPNALIWSGSYALGAGFTLGGGSVVAPAATTLGILPGLPLLGALPTNGPGSVVELWWLAAGALAGVAAAWVVVRSRRRARFDLTSLVGGLAGGLAAVVFVGLAWATSGDLGTVRLAGLGPRLLPLLVLAGSTMGLSGLIAGLVLALVRRRR